MSWHLSSLEGFLTLHIYEYSQKSYTINPSYNIIELLRKFSQGNAFMGQIQIFVTQISISYGPKKLIITYCLSSPTLEHLVLSEPESLVWATNFILCTRVCLQLSCVLCSVELICESQHRVGSTLWPAHAYFIVWALQIVFSKLSCTHFWTPPV